MNSISKWGLFMLALPRAATSQNTSSYAGANNYFLHGVAQADQVTYLETLASWGAKVVRLWVTQTPGTCVKGSPTANISAFELPGSIGTYQYGVLDALDNTLKLLHDNGLKAIISPQDAGTLNGSNGCDAYCDKYGSSDNFYNNASAISDYDNRLAAILNYESPNFGKPWSQLSEVIMAFDIQNEPMIGSVDILEADDPNGWLCGRATKLKDLIDCADVHVATGGIGGSEYCCNHEYNLLPAALNCSTIDIMSVHGYMTEASQWEYFIPSPLVNQSIAAGKHLMIEEWGVTASPAGQFADQVAVFNNAGVPWVYWEVIPGCDQTQNCTGPCSGASNGYDGYEIGLNSTKANVQSGIAAANAAQATQNWAGYVD